MLFEPLFQFYDSPIKSGMQTILLKKQASFNSMIVRLKVSYKEKTFRISSFQFYDSPIKRRSKCCYVDIDAGFNSMIVRLKGKKVCIFAVPALRVSIL